MKVYVVTVEYGSSFFRVVAVVSSMDEVVRRFGTTWKERFEVYETKVDEDMPPTRQGI